MRFGLVSATTERLRQHRPPEEQLVYSIILRALYDLAWKGTSRDSAFIRRDAQLWLDECCDEVGSLVYYCDLVGLNPAAVRGLGREVLDGRKVKFGTGVFGAKKCKTP